MAQKIGQLGQIPVDGIKRSGTKLAQIVGEYFGGCHLGNLAKLLHLPPDDASVQRSPAFIPENVARSDASAFGKASQPLPQIPGQEDRPGLALA